MKKSSGRSIVIMMLAVNSVLIAGIIALFFVFSGQYKKNLEAENLNNIRNLNQSSANIAAAYFESRQTKLQDIVLYVQTGGLDFDKTMDYIYSSTSVGTDERFQLVGDDFVGLEATKDSDGGFIAVSYTNNDYGDLQKILASAGSHGECSVIHCAPEFTDSSNPVRSFALYTYINISDGSGRTKPYTLLSVAKSKNVVSIVNPDGGYDNMTTVVMDSAGNYILKTGEFKGTNFFDFLYNYNDLTLDQRNEAAKQVRALNSGELFYKSSYGDDCVFRYTTIDGSEWYCVTCVPLSSFHIGDFSLTFALVSAAIMFMMLCIDVTWLLRLNRRLAQSMLREKEANSAKTDFLSRMSHDIRTPLNGIIGTTALAKEENNNPSTAEYLRVIESSGQFLLGLVNDVLDMSKVESGSMELSPEPYSYVQLREYISAIILPLCQSKEVELSMTGEEGGLPLMFDRLRLNQIVFNLLSNAVKFTPAGGLVEFNVVRSRLPGGRAALDLTVRDNGIGMSPEFQQRMFESFAQEKRTAGSTNQGTGLGLAIVKNLVGLMGGSINVESEENVGTAFFVHLEADVCPETTEELTAKKAVDYSCLSGKRVLLCEDNQVNAMIACRLLERKSMIIDEAVDGRAGLEAFIRSDVGYYDFILMDVMMPEMDGLEATRAIRACDRSDAKTVPIIAMTANAYAQDVKSCIDAGMNSHLSKPISTEVLFSELVRFLPNGNS